MTDYNQNGVEYITYGQNFGMAIGGYMSDEAVTLKISARNALLAESQDEAGRRRIRRIYGILHHLDGFLLSVERIVESVDRIRNTTLGDHLDPEFPKTIMKRADHKEPVGFPPSLISINTHLIEIELETLLLRAVSALERLTKQIEESLGVTIPNFFNLESAISAQAATSPLASQLLTLIVDIKPRLLGIVLSDGKGVSLRNIVAHRASSPELIEKGVTVQWLEDGRILAFDAELDQIPMIGTVYSLAQTIPYFILSALRAILSTGTAGLISKQWADSVTISEETFKPSWKNPFIHYSHFIDETDTGPRVSLVAITPGGTWAHQRHLRPEVFDFAVRPTNPEAMPQPASSNPNTHE